jgi:arylsulfatase A-like enzyme
MKPILLGTGILSLLISCTAEKPEKPNVLFISMDDQNDWIGVFGGNGQVITPYMDKFCQEGAVAFTNAHCAGPVCCPSRSALLSGFRPETTGVYENTQNMLRSELVTRHATLPEYFSKNGYLTISKGKIFHRHPDDQGEWAFDIWEPVKGNFKPQQDKLTGRNEEMINGVREDNPVYSDKGKVPFPWNKGDKGFSWAPTISGKEETADYLTAQWFAEQLNKDYEKPFFMAVGFAKPHSPYYVPQEYFDLYNLDDIKIPEFRPDDLEDILTPAGKKKFEPSHDFLWVRQNDELFKAAVRAYMATISYVDECVGVVLDALENSKYRENTIVILWSDHGYHMGEKLRFHKGTAWTQSTKMPLAIRVPGMQEGRECRRVVNLMDLYPTLVELCGLPERKNLEGRSLVPLLTDPGRKWPYPSMTTLSDGTFTVNDEEWRYTRYEDGTEELYDLVNDPGEWNNLIRSDKPEALEAKNRLARWMPEKGKPGVAENTASANDVQPTAEQRALLRSDQFRPLGELK